MKVVRKINSIEPNILQDEKRKNSTQECEIITNFGSLTKINAKYEMFNNIQKAYESDLILYIKALLQASSTIPNIIKILDSIIEKRASTYISTSTIFGSADSTYEQVNKVIDLTERKQKLINLHIMVKEILLSLSEEDRTLAKLKFVKRYNVEEISKDLNIVERTIYRRSNRILEKIALFMLNKGWDVEFLKHQLKKEPWIEDLVQKKKQEQETNLVRARKNKK